MIEKIIIIQLQIRLEIALFYKSILLLLSVLLW